jgi:pimeloyl-ACP methyl ester carboxylesterase
MKEDRIRRALSADGTEITARVYGEGPNLMFLPAGPGDSETSWRAVVPHLEQEFTCWLVNTRGRGLSTDHPDHSPQRLVEDVHALMEMAGEPAGIIEAGSGLWARVAADHRSTVAAAAIYEPGADEVLDKKTGMWLEAALTRTEALTNAGQTEDAVRAFVDKSGAIYNDAELTAGVPFDFWEESVPNLAIFFKEQQQAAEPGLPGATSPQLLAKIKAPVLILIGSETRPWFIESASHVAAHVADPHIRSIGGAGHFGIITHAEAVADELRRFFSRVMEPSGQDMRAKGAS